MQYPIALSSQESPGQHRRHGARRLGVGWSLVFSALLLGGGLAAANLPHGWGTPSASPQLLQQVVQRQLRALARENAGEAFALADVGLRTQFGSPEAFLATVRDEYPMLMHPASLLFLKPRTDGSFAMQKVRLTDEDGASWSLTYLLNRQQDDQWKISGCVVTPEGRQVMT
ncbi:hypothetical protein GCM10028796_56830 [Ramlibacter monticola]|uniref:DUF4864 domain-containing protein n=1 Tax=Ramlibacter monticola TaxID=1926872 RepID=A0A936Z4N4_9BURK|nr:DUF4864 domain-containing protein [Ramlibacter monticola]MBL0395075.1 DUF4864 domain-containing protein [Ramlibacter monticola]